MLLRTAAAVVLCALAPLTAAEPKRAKNVILFLADAGGIPTLNAASIVAHGAPQKLFVQSWPAVALSDTSASSSWVTDSAAGMTAIVTGKKTRNGVISQGPDTIRGQKDGTKLKTILEYAEERGLSTGVLSNVNIADATPAACYGHANDRSKHGELFLEIFSPRFGDGVDVVFGPGRKRIWDSASGIGKDIDAIAKEKGREIYSDLNDVPDDTDRALAVLPGSIDLNVAAKKALKKLSRNPQGYFLMIESDAHTDDPEAGISRLIAFDKLIKEIAEMVNLDETLLLFTADHSFDLRVRAGNATESLLKGAAEWKLDTASDKKNVRLPYLRVEGSHTGEEVLATAKGPGSELVTGFIPNTRLFEIMLAAYGWTGTTTSASE
jgi:alkaline phosphatase